MEFLLYNKQKLGNTRRFMSEVFFKFPDEFLMSVNQRDNTRPNYQLVTDFDGAIITVRNDEHPTFFTSFDDKHIVMDSFDSNIESTLQASNTQISLFMTPNWSVDNSFVPDLPSEMFPLLLAESTTFSQARKDDILIKKTEQTATRHQRHLSQTHGIVQKGVRYPNYGRKGSKSSGSDNRSSIFGPRS